MAQTLEERMFARYWGDGALELLSGVGLLLIGIGWLVDQVALAAVVPAVLVPLYQPVRARAVEPYAGHVTFSARRDARQRRHAARMIAAGVACFAFALAAFLLVTGGEGPRAFGSLVGGLPAVLVAGMAAAVGVSLGLSRMLLYALLLVLLAPVVVLLDTNPGWPFVLVGVVAAAVGGALLLRLRRAAGSE
ncbi:MAG: hypothetical protein H6713_06895 [Myxococcales bacterium]|nr:hypothetical protein [Myxococcales bacterium]